MANDAVYVNLDEGLARLMNNRTLYVRLLAKFKNGTSTEALETAFAAGDVDKAIGEAHTLKGLAANLSLSELTQRCLELESQAKGGTLHPQCLDALKAAFAATIGEIEKVVAENG